MLLYVFMVCLCASTIGGVCGIGGGVLIKPLLDMTGMMSVSTVSFLSGLTVLAMALISVWKNRRTADIDVRRSVPLGIGAALGGVLGKQLFEAIKQAVDKDQVLGIIQAVMLGIMALGTLVYVRRKAHIRTKNVQNPVGASLIGIALGLSSAFLSIGGGPMNLAVLHYFFSMSTRQATVNSLLIIMLSQAMSLIMSLALGNVPEFEIPIFIAMVGAGVMGGLFSVRLHKRLSAAAADRLFCCLMIGIVLICCYNTVKWL